MVSEGPSRHPVSTGSYQGDRAKLFIDMPTGRLKDNRHRNETREVWVRCKENLDPHMDRQTVEQPVHRGCVLSLLSSF